MKAFFFQVVRSGGRGVATCIVVVEQQTLGAVVWTTKGKPWADKG